jgi:hypothetical protein
MPYHTRNKAGTNLVVSVAVIALNHTVSALNHANILGLLLSLSRKTEREEKTEEEKCGTVWKK